MTETKTDDPLTRPAHLAGLWLGVLGPPAVWLTQFELNYVLVSWVCAHGHKLVLWSVSGAAVLAAIALGGLAWANWRRVGMTWPSASADRPTRTRFLAALGVLASALFLIATVAQGCGVIFIDPCRQ
jgi:hypothetical protein